MIKRTGRNKSMKLMILLAAGVSLDTWGIGVSYAVSGITCIIQSGDRLYQFMHDSNGGFYGTMAGTVDPGTMDQPDCRRNSCDPGDTNVVEYKRPGRTGV